MIVVLGIIVAVVLEVAVAVNTVALVISGNGTAASIK